MEEPSSPSAATLWTPTKPPPTRAVSLDSAALVSSEESRDEFQSQLPLGTMHSRIPSNALSRTKLRSYTSPHLVTQTKGGSVVNDSDERQREWIKNRLNRSMSPSILEVTHVDVFLGGSCNPTTWRKDVAVPVLDGESINYFNPQVDDWYDELVYEEARAKEGAKILLMVIDGSTRAIVSINECVEYICRGRRLVLAVQNIEPGTTIDGTVVTDSELADLNGARECLRRLAYRRGVPLFNDIRSAVDCVVECVVNKNPVQFPPEVPRLRKRSSIVLNAMAGRYRLQESAPRSWSSTHSLSIVSSLDENDEGGPEEPSGTQSDWSYVRHAGTSMSRPHGGYVYLGGNLQSTSWREKVAVPRLQNAGVPFFIPHQDYLTFELQRLDTAHPTTGGEHLRQMEIKREKAELVLFVIPDRTRSIAAMTEAVELICNCRAIFLVIEPLEENCILDDGTQLANREFRDVARARVYLQEMAERHHVEVFRQ